MALRLPVDVGVRMAAQSAIGNVDAPARYLEDEDVYVNAAYGPGEPAFDIDVSTGVGEVVVRSGDEPLPDDITDENLEEVKPQMDTDEHRTGQKKPDSLVLSR
ncbi:MAG: hypothetical protein R2838_10220 [Caldilineaceae bacterium]